MVSKHFPPFRGGLEVRVFEIGRWLVASKEGVLVLTSREPGTGSKELVEGMDVRRSRVLFSAFNASFAPGVLLDLMRLDYDVIDLNLPDPANSVWALLASVLRGKPMVVTYHADIIKGGLMFLPFSLVYSPIQSLVLRRSRRIMVTSPDYAQSSQALGRFMDKVVVASSFIDPVKYNTSVDGASVRQKHALSGKVVLFVGRLVPYKGVEYLIDAAREIPRATFIIVGEGPLKESLVRKASGLRNVLFAGKVDDKELPGYFRACDVFVLPSITRQEAFGLVLVEAMACGKPVVSVNFSGMPYVVGDGGLLVNPEDGHALAEAIKRILGEGALSANLAKKGLKRVRELFSRDVVCEKIVDVYKSALSRI